MKTTRKPNAPDAVMERRPARPSPETDANSRAALLASLSPAEIRKAQSTSAGRRFLGRLRGELEHRTPSGKPKAKKRPPATSARTTVRQGRGMPLSLAQARLRALKIRNDAGRRP